MIDGAPTPVYFGGYPIIRPYCDCARIGRGFTLHNGMWVRPCCGRPTQQVHSVNQEGSQQCSTSS